MGSIGAIANIYASPKSTKQQNSNGTRSEVTQGAHKRTRRTPNRYGNVTQLNLSDDEEDLFDDPLNLLDNSFEDENYVPPSPKVVATVSRTKAMHINKKSKQEKINMDDEWDFLSNVLEPTTSAVASSEMAVDMDGDMPKPNERTQHIDKNEDGCSANKLDVCYQILGHVTDMSARLSALEKAMLDNGFLENSHRPNIVQKITDGRIFNTANRLPLQNLADLENFELNLKEAEFLSVAVSMHGCVFFYFPP